LATTLIDWSDAHKRLAAARSQLQKVAATLSKHGAEAMGLSNTKPGVQPAATVFMLRPGFLFLPNLPAEQDVQQAINDFKAAHDAENRAFIGLDQTDQKTVEKNR